MSRIYVHSDGHTTKKCGLFTSLLLRLTTRWRLIGTWKVKH